MSVKSAAMRTTISTSRAASDVLSCRLWRTRPGVTVQVCTSSTAGSSGARNPGDQSADPQNTAGFGFHRGGFGLHAVDQHQRLAEHPGIAVQQPGKPRRAANTQAWGARDRGVSAGGAGQPPVRVEP
ncbi:MAG: hypothetical protein ABIO34_02565 [Arthrobacter oryzae]